MFASTAPTRPRTLIPTLEGDESVDTEVLGRG